MTCHDTTRMHDKPIKGHFPYEMLCFMWRQGSVTRDQLRVRFPETNSDYFATAISRYRCEKIGNAYMVSSDLAAWFAEVEGGETKQPAPEYKGEIVQPRAHNKFLGDIGAKYAKSLREVLGRRGPINEVDHHSVGPCVSNVLRGVKLA